MNKFIKNLITPNDLSLDQLNDLISLAQDISKNPERFFKSAEGKILASMFYEPSTRTKFSFDTAMLRLGGRVVGFSDPAGSSAAKGETVADSAKTVSQYADIIVVRHPKEGTALLMSKHADCPVINAGDGGHQHPTQTLTDLATIKSCLGRLTDLTVGVCGDLMFGRTIHSLVTCMARFSGINFVFISPKELTMPVYVKQAVMQNGKTFTETNDLEEAIPNLDILYMSRVQRERFVSEEEYLRLKDYFILNSEKLSYAKKEMIILHPLPRVNEIAVEVDLDRRAKYFEQVKYGMFVRMALILKMLGLR